MDRPPDSADPAPETLTELILRASAQVSSTLGIRLKPLRVQVDEMRVLHALSAGGGMSMTELSEALVIGGPTLTRMADRLVSENLVYRAPDPHDRRRVRLHLTEAGEDLRCGGGRDRCGHATIADCALCRTGSGRSVVGPGANGFAAARLIRRPPPSRNPARRRFAAHERFGRGKPLFRAGLLDRIGR